MRKRIYHTYSRVRDAVGARTPTRDTEHCWLCCKPPANLVISLPKVLARNASCSECGMKCFSVNQHETSPQGRSVDIARLHYSTGCCLLEHFGCLDTGCLDTTQIALKPVKSRESSWVHQPQSLSLCGLFEMLNYSFNATLKKFTSCCRFHVSLLRYALVQFVAAVLSVEPFTHASSHSLRLIHRNEVCSSEYSYQKTTKNAASLNTIRLHSLLILSLKLRVCFLWT